MTSRRMRPLRHKMMLSLAGVLGLATMSASAAVLDLGSPEQSAEAIAKMRCSLDPAEDVIAWWSGTMFAQEPGAAVKPLLGFEGYNICRSEKLDDGTWRLVTRELTFYRDLKTGEILDTWENPLSGKTNTVIDVDNDPVNQVLNPPGRPPMPLQWQRNEDALMLTMNIPLAYPNPLQPSEFPAESSGETYIGSEHFMWFSSHKAMVDPETKSAPLSYGWTRIGPWLPWMELGQRPGNLLYIAQGGKIPGFDALPADVQQRVKDRYPKYQKAPETWETPNVTSWTHYRQLKQAADAK